MVLLSSALDIASSTLIHHTLALAFLAVYLGTALSVETSSRFVQDSRFSKPPDRPGSLGPVSRHAH
eukprot:1711071-Pyramimonas_sp.AAC.1